MATIWAWRYDAGNWAENDPEKTGWSHQIAFNGLSDLVQKLDALGPAVKGQVTKLGIAAHGNEPAMVQIDPVLTTTTAMSLEKDLRRLNDFLAPYARLIFFSCIAGAGDRGSAFLNLLSSQFFPHRYVIGFEVFGLFGRGVNAPGAVNASDANRFSIPAGPGANTSRLTEYSWWAKWSLDGTIIRKSANDQGAIKHVERQAVGIKAVEEMIEKNRSSDTIVYVALENGRLRLRVFGLGNPMVARKVKIVSGAELTRLAGTSHHEGVVGAWDDLVSPRRCANPSCPGHAQATDFCVSFAGQFPNGPLR